MNRVLAVCAVLVMCSIGSMVLAAEGEPPVVKGNIEVYGQAKLSVDVIDTDNKTGGADKTLYRVSSNSSRLGFKGTQALSDDLNAVVQLELGVNFDGSQTSVVSSVTSASTNTTTGATTVKTKSANIDKITYRNSYAGLSHKAIGTLIFGIHDTPYKQATGSLDAFGDSMADYNSIIGNVNGATDFDLRAKDTIMYSSAKMSGFQVMAQTSTKGVESDNGAAGNPSEYSASASYSGGPLFASLAYETHRNGYGSFDTTGSKVEGTKAGVGFAFGGTKLGLVYEKLKDDKADSIFSRDAYYAAVRQKLGHETIKIAYAKADDGENPATSTGASMIAAGVEHAFSKRTTAYILYAKTKNDSDAKYGLGQGGAGGAYAPATGGDSPSVISVGLNHTF